MNLAATGVSMQAVAGMRYKAWKLYSGLHQTLPIDEASGEFPMTLDLRTLDCARASDDAGATCPVSAPPSPNIAPP